MGGGEKKFPKNNWGKNTKNPGKPTKPKPLGEKGGVGADWAPTKKKKKQFVNPPPFS